MTKRVA